MAQSHSGLWRGGLTEPPRREAFWAEGVRQGALYVRRGQTLLQVIVRGDEGKEAKMAKLRLLVGKALKRLRE